MPRPPEGEAMSVRMTLAGEDAVRELRRIGPHGHPIGVPGGAIHQVDGGLSVIDGAILKAAREIEAQARNGLPGGFEFGALHMGVEIQVDRGAVHDLRNLIVLVVVEKHVGVQRQAAVQQRVLGAEFIGVDEFRREGCGMRRERLAGQTCNFWARRVGAATLVTARIGCVEQRLIGEIQFRGPVHVEAAGPFLPFLIDGAFDRIAAAFEEGPARNVPEALAVVGPAQSPRQLHIGRHLVIGPRQTRRRNSGDRDSRCGSSCVPAR